ncbi:MAG: type I-C CRISPR-associated endonuclease Cas1c [Bacillota bacterium]|jgi:CRISPR-associated protein Cas1
MKKLLNTLYVTTPLSYLSLENENIVILLEEKEKFRIPFANVEGIVCFGYMGASPALMGKCAENNISLSFLSPSGKFLARVTGKTKGSVLLRKKQYQFAEDRQASLFLAQNIVAAKLFNSRNTIERSIRDNADAVKISKLIDVSKLLKGNLQKAYDFHDLDELRGFEGAYAKAYFSVFDEMILQQKKHFYFTERNKRPPLDNVNCMLSYLYIILALEITAALETVGLDPYVGFMHQIRPGRASLALDLLEELRSYLVDRHILTLINLKQMTNKDFHKKEGGGILLTDERRRKLLDSWQKQKKEKIRHPIINEKIEIGLIPYVQAQLMARFLRGDVEEYPPFLCR